MKSAPVIIKKKSAKNKAEKNSFTVVAIGASAGGLEAISVLLKNLPSDTGMAFIYVQHLSPDHKSFLTPILSKLTNMKVQEIENMEHMEPDNVYVIPHNKGIEVTNGHIQLIPRTTNFSIDVLFTSLAQTHKENVIGVILSGNGNDGTLGLKAIKSAGGITFVQDNSAQISSMPESAIAAGVVDFVLSPKKIAAKLSAFGKKGLVRPVIKRKQKVEGTENINSDLETIFAILYEKTGVDFSHYKMPTIKRRMNHKMVQSGVKTIKDYSRILSTSEKEVKLLFNDLLINVTSFFRDKQAFQFLKTTLLPKLLKGKTVEQVLRIWVPACSTGQEAYSIAMIIAELQYNKTRKIPVQIFATDLHEPSIRIARNAEYSLSDIKSIPKKYQERYFTKTGDKFRIVKELREMCVIASHNILRDPPFSHMDFISCCNLLIYFDTTAQKKVFTTLHFALKEKGYLMLGKAETIGASAQLFTVMDNKFKIYSRKKATGVRKILELTPRFSLSKLIGKTESMPVKTTKVNPTGIENAIDSALLSNYMPACAVVNKDMEILQFRGPVSLFLAHPSGKASLNILKMTRPEFGFELRNAIQKAIKTKQTVMKSGIEIKIESVLKMMSLEVRHLKIEWDEPLLLIVFTLQEEVEKFIESKNGKNNNDTQKDIRIKKLTEELNNTRTEMNAVIESQETIYEDLQAANEEIVSSNEEFQTLNEELETSKEEIEATNEELISTNQELQMRNELLMESQEYSEAIIATIHEPMLILTKDLLIKSANKSFYKKFMVKKEQTEGVLLFDLGNKQWNIPKLREALNDILFKNKGFENFEVTHTFPGIGEKVMLLNAHLIIQKAKSEQLILLAIEDITERSLYTLKEKFSLSLIEASLDPLVTISMEGKITDMNQATANITGLSRDMPTGTDFFNYFTEPQKAREVYQQVFARGSVADFPLTLRHKSGKLTDVLFNGSVYKDDKGNVLGVVIVARDVTAQKLLSKYSLSLIEASLDPLVTISTEGKITDTNEATVNITGISREKLIGSDFFNYFTEPQKARAVYKEVFAKGSVADSPLTLRHKKGKLTDVLFNGSVYKDDRGNVLGVVIVARDVTEQKRIAEELTEAKIFAELATGIAEDAKEKAEKATQIAEDAVKAKQQFLSNMSHEIRTPMNAIIGFTKVVLKTDLSEKQKEYLSAIKTSGDALIVLINDILDLAKVDAGKMIFEKTPFKMWSSVSAMLHLFEAKILEKNLELIKEYDNKIPEILVGDPVRLHQIILNLLSNAVKFTSQGRITVSVRLLNEDKKNVTIEFAVTDTGIGISENKIATIFENFQQASSDTSRLFGGTGLGLAIVKQLVEPQGGTVAVKSKMGEGTSFSFTLSFQKTVAEIDLESALMELDNEVKDIKVLVVEDIVLNQLLMKTLLDDFGFERDIAANGKIAIEKLKNNTYDIILMDLQMPEMNGFEATEFIRKEMKSNIPIIALTADVTTVDVAKCKAAGMNDYIAKPVDERLLYSKILGLVKKPGALKFGEEKKNNASTKSKCINLDYLNQRTKYNPTLMLEMISLYLEQTPPLIMCMKKSLIDKDWKKLHAAVHKTIPSFSIMGISPKFENLAKKVQDYARKEYNVEELPALILQLEKVLSQACVELKAEFNLIKGISE